MPITLDIMELQYHLKVLGLEADVKEAHHFNLPSNEVVVASKGDYRVAAELITIINFAEKGKLKFLAKDMYLTLHYEIVRGKLGV